MPVEFGDLPPSASPGRPSVWDDVVKQLKANPQKWARIQTSKNPAGATNLAHRMRSGITKAFRPAGSFETTARGHDVWARYVGDEAES